MLFLNMDRSDTVLVSVVLIPKCMVHRDIRDVHDIIYTGIVAASKLLKPYLEKFWLFSSLPKARHVERRVATHHADLSSCRIMSAKVFTLPLSVHAGGFHLWTFTRGYFKHMIGHMGHLISMVLPKSERLYGDFIRTSDWQHEVQSASTTYAH